MHAWALAELQAGRLTVAQVRNGLPATRALLTGEKTPSQVSEADDALLDDLLDALRDLPETVLDDLFAALPEEIFNRLLNSV